MNKNSECTECVIFQINSYESVLTWQIVLLGLCFAEKRKEPPGVSDTKPSSSELVNSQASAGANTTAPVNSTSGQKGSKRSRR
jgi:hypothetical protein